MSTNYYYAHDGQQLGPVSTAELKSLARAGTLLPDHLVWTQGWPNWLPATKVRGLFEADAPTAAPAPAVSRVKMAATAGHTSAPPANPAGPPSGPAGPAVTSPAGGETPGVSTASKSMANPGGSANRTAADWAKGVWDTVRETATLTARHLAGVGGWCMALVRSRGANRAALDSQTALGQKLASSGHGDEGLRRTIGGLTERITSVKAAGSSPRQIERELAATHAQLSAAELEHDRPLPGMEAELAAARSARDAAQAARNEVAEARTKIRSLFAQHGLKIGAGYLCIGLMFTAVVWATQGSEEGSAESQSSPDSPPPEDVAQDAGTGDGVDGGSPVDNGESVLPGLGQEEFLPSTGTGDQTQTCFNCNGTGQANCQQCFGSGKRACFNCNSTGRTVNNMQCFQCFGTGQQNCSFCQFGRVQCPQCFGSGRR